MMTSGGSYLFILTTGAAVVVPMPTDCPTVFPEPMVIDEAPTLTTWTLVIIPTCVEGDAKVVWAIETKEPGLIPSVVATDIMVVVGLF